jgi:hypothetical protein
MKCWLHYLVETTLQNLYKTVCLDSSSFHTPLYLIINKGLFHSLIS